MSGLFAGTAKIDITPNEPVHLIPTSDSRRTSKGVNHRLHARVLVLRHSDKTEEYRYAVFVSADIIYFPHSCVESLRAQIAARWGIGQEEVVLQATHTHSAPYPVYGFVASAFDCSRDEEYNSFIGSMEQAILSGIGQAMADLKPVGAGRGSGLCTFSSYRRKLLDGQWVMAPDEQGPADQEVSVVRFSEPDGQVKALLVHYTCHPTTTYEDYLSSDYPGTAMDLIEEQLGGGAVSLFMQGCCGDIRPGVIRDGRYYHGSDEDVRRFAGELSREVLTVITRPMKPVERLSFDFHHNTIELPYRSVPGRAELEAARNSEGLIGKWSRKLLADPESLRTCETLDMTYIRLSDELAFLAMNGETVVEYGRFIKERSAGKTIPLGYSNGNIGYLPTARQLEEGGYEGYSFFYNQGRPSPFDGSIERLIKEGISGLMDGE